LPVPLKGGTFLLNYKPENPYHLAAIKPGSNRNRFRFAGITLIFLLTLLLISTPVMAAVEGFVAKDHTGIYHQYDYNTLLNSYALRMIGLSDGLHEDFLLKKPVALLGSETGYIDYSAVLDYYAKNLIKGESFNLNRYITSGAVQAANMPATVKLVSLNAGKLTRTNFNTGQNSGAETAPMPDPTPEPEPVKPITVTPIIGSATVTVARAQQWAASNRADQRFIDIASLYWGYGSRTGIRPEVLYAQAAHETAFGRYSGQVPPAYNNWAGIKTAVASGDTPEDHEQFATPEDGVRGHFNHMSAYVGLSPLGEPHARYHIVARLYWAGKVTTVEELSGRWAPSLTYHEKVVAMVKAMQQ
jgi:hypothetical protein